SERNVWGGSRRPGGAPRAHEHGGLGRRRTRARAGRGHAGPPRRLASWHRVHDPRGPHPPPAGAPRRGLSAARARFQPERAAPAAAHSVQRALGEHLAAPVLSLLARLGTRHALRRAARLDQLDCSRSLRHPLGDPVGPLRAAPRLSDFLQRQHPRYGWTDPCPRSHGAARAGRCAGRLRGRSRDRRPPFMVEQSRPAERVHLFSIGSFLTVGAASLGNLLAGVLPMAFAPLLGLGPESAGALRAGLFCVLPVMLCSALPIYLIDERWQPIDIKRWWRSLDSHGTISMLALTEGGAGLALGMTAPFFAVFFAHELH